jgi:hypothetical protein
VGPFIFFFVAFTLAEIMFSACYYYVVQRIDLTLILGLLIYIGLMVTGYTACRKELYREKRQALLDSLCQ